MENTLARDLRGIAALYEWAESTLRINLDDMLERSEIPSGRSLESLIAHLRQRTVSDGSSRINSLATVAVKAMSIRMFLKWAADPTGQGSMRRKPLQQVAQERAMLDTLFRPLERYAAASERIQPLTPVEFKSIRTIFGPVTDQNGAIVVPIQFHQQNPFRPASRLRNWLMISTARECGHRRGELLKTRLDDIPRSTDVGLKIRRRPHDRSDTRRYKPRVKTIERVLDISPELRFSLRAYISSPAPLGRRSGRSPYLFTSAAGAPLSISSADGVVEVVARHTGIDHLSWHSFRHTWAEELADDLLNHHLEGVALQMIRELGGWKPNSSTPMHYIQNAIRKRAFEFLRERNSRMYSDREGQ
jgi:integrase